MRAAILLIAVLAYACEAPRQPVATTQTPALALLSTRGYPSSSSFMSVQGEVQNISDRTLSGVVAVSTWYDKAGTLITSDATTLDFDPLAPGQRAPFKTISKTFPGMETYAVTFRLGTVRIPHEDRRPK